LGSDAWHVGYEIFVVVIKVIITLLTTLSTFITNIFQLIVFS